MKINGKSFGVLYFVDENPMFQEMLAISVNSLKKFHPDWPIEVVQIPSLPISVARRIYRSVSVWKNKKRRARANQDFRLIAKKADIMLASPFDITLYLDVDTVITKDLLALAKRACEVDVVVTQLPWKRYQGTQDWQPESFPYSMAGVAFYNRRFIENYRNYVNRVGPEVAKLPTGDQFIFSLALYCENENLDVVYEPTLQLDVLNAAQHLSNESFSQLDGGLDIRAECLNRFHVFHYNDDKPFYMKQIAKYWNLHGNSKISDSNILT